MSVKYKYSLLNLLALSVAMPALAQQASTGAEGSGPQQDENRDIVVVTAQKREETVQDIAVAVTAISSQLRDEIGLNTVQDYTNFTPGFAYSSSNDRLGMRGVARNSNNFGIRSGISNYVDGVYYSSALPASRAPILVERVEIVRGPQGTLYGRDAIGGALNVISKRPTDNFEAQFNAGVGSFGFAKLEGTASGPITDWLRYRVAATRTKQDEGYFTDVATGETEGGRLDDYFLEAQLEGNVGDRLDWWVRYATSSWSRLGSPGGRVNTGDKSPYDTRLAPAGSTLPNSAFGFVTPGYTQIGTQATNPTDIFQFNTDSAAIATLPHSNELALEAIYHAPGFDVKYLGGYVYYKYNLQQDNDGFPVTSFPLRFPQTTAGVTRTILPKAESDYTENRMWYSNEINIVSTHDGPLQWITGLYQYQEDYSQPTYSFLTDAPALASPAQSLRQLNATTLVPRPLVGAPGHPGSALRTYTNNEGLNHAYGAFAQGDYSFNDQWKVTLGVRYSQDNAKTKEYGRLICYYVCGLTGATAGVVALRPGSSERPPQTDSRGLQRTPRATVSAS
jgi:iron complex outermembrane recepter protein